MPRRVLIGVLLALPAALAAQRDTTVIRPTPNLVADGLPAIPASIAAEVRP